MVKKRNEVIMKILVDADGCPVVKSAVKIAGKFNIEIILFCDTSHIFNSDYAKIVTVSKGADSADFALVNKIDGGDIIVTQDYGLAAMALSRKGIPLTQNGLIITADNIDGLLNSRYMAKKARMAGKRLKGPSKRTKEQDEAFENSLTALLSAKGT